MKRKMENVIENACMKLAEEVAREDTREEVHEGLSRIKNRIEFIKILNNADDEVTERMNGKLIGQSEFIYAFENFLSDCLS